MTISSLAIPLYTSLPTGQSGLANNTSTAATNSGSLGVELLAALEQSQTASSASPNSLLQDMVSLSPAALGQTTTTPLTYNAQGLLAQIQSNLQLNDPLLQSDSADTNGTNGDSLLQSLMSSPQVQTAGGNSLASTSVQAPTTTAGSTDPNVNWWR